MVVGFPAQDNLSLALRHILQQIVDSTNPNGHKNTDMTLPYDGYIQKLSWYFECDKCHYKAFYSHDMENHKHTCMLSRDFKSQFKKRKVTAPKRVSSTTHPPNEDSDQDSQPSMPVPPPLKVSFPADRSVSNPVTTESSSVETAESSMPTLTLTKNQTTSEIVSMEPASLEFDAELAISEDMDSIIADNHSETHKSLDFELKEGTHTDEEQQERDDDITEPHSIDFDPDILEIKVEVNEGQEASSSSAAATKDSTIDPSLLPTDILFPPSDASIDSMMSMFTSQTSTQSMPSVPSTSTPRHPPSFKATSAMRPEFPRNTLPSIQNVRMPTGPLSTSYPNVATHSQHLHRPRLPYMHQQLQRQQQQIQQQQQQQLASQSSAYKRVTAPCELPIMSMSDDDFINNYAYQLKRLLTMDDSAYEISHTRIQQMHYCPFSRSEEGKKVYTAILAKNFLYRIASIGFGNVKQGKTKKVTFARNRWTNLNNFCKNTLAKLGITESAWISPVD